MYNGLFPELYQSFASDRIIEIQAEAGGIIRISVKQYKWLLAVKESR